MGQSVPSFVSHSSNDKESFIEPIVQDLEDCYINDLTECPLFHSRINNKELGKKDILG